MYLQVGLLKRQLLHKQAADGVAATSLARLNGDLLAHGGEPLIHLVGDLHRG